MNKKQDEKVIHYYNESQFLYDIFWMNKRNLAMHFGYWKPDTKNRHEALMNENLDVEKSLRIVKDDIVLDAGCGVGGSSIQIAKQYGVRVVGIGLVEKQIKSAIRNAEIRGVEGLTSFKVVDFNKTKFEDESFTKIFAIESACHSEDKEEFIKEAHRLLKPGGRLVVCDYFVNNLKDNKDKKNYQTFCEGWAMANLTKKEDYGNYLRKNKFININFIDHTKETLKSSRYMSNLAKIWLPIDLILNALRIIKPEDVVGTKASISQYPLFKDGVLLHGIFSAEKSMGG